MSSVAVAKQSRGISAVALPYMAILIGLALADIWEWFDRRDLRLAVCYRVAAPLLVLFLLWCNVKVWHSYYTKYRDCDYERTISELRRIIPPHAKSVMGRYDFWIGLTDYTYYRRGFRTFKDIEAIAPEIIIHNDTDIRRPESAELKRQLDAYLADHGELIGRVKGHPRGWCACGNLAVYRVNWQ
ncbi:MAG: hypothetical protein J7M12_03335 [Candidatus Hydrogenedentes bacterium]|nr:hypothetical protein [Candidatus Hydrogenedentota bacterium]